MDCENIETRWIGWFETAWITKVWRIESKRHFIVHAKWKSPTKVGWEYHSLDLVGNALGISTNRETPFRFLRAARAS
jgi:hypothetical protein